MKKFKYSILLLLGVLTAARQPIQGQSFTATENHVAEYVPFAATTATPTTANAVIKATYFDGLGRPMQEVAVNGAASGRDLVRPITYDAAGRENIVYLPYERTGTLGVYTANATAVAAQKAFYTSLHGATDAAYAFSQTRFENSPLSRPLEEASPGSAWRIGGGQTARHNHRSNTTADAVKRWIISDAGVLSQSATHNAGMLTATETTGADNMVSVTFTDKRGQTIEVWQKSGTTILRTSYVYDDWGRLRVVIPPKAQTATLNSADFNALVYRYAYDSRGRMIEKIVPGAAVEYMVYDSRDRLVMYQDGNLRAAAKWKTLLYDAVNRPVAEGLVACTVTPANLRSYYSITYVNQTRNSAAYTLNTVANVPALTANGVMSYTYYDDYAGVPLTYNAADFAATAPATASRTKGHQTWGRVKVLDGTEETASGKWINSATVYDYRFRPIQVLKDLYDGTTAGKATVSTNFAFDGNPERVREKQTFNGVTTTVDMRYDYDHLRRPVKAYHKINAQAEVAVATTTYDALGRAKTKTMGNAELVTYTYNIRNWLAKTASAKFTADLSYTYAGNISKQVSSNNGTALTYNYAYDGFSRLTSGVAGSFSESGITYDANGNITKLVRAGGVNGATYNYVYSGNRLSTLNGVAYTYDANGNTTKDGLRGFTIAYNLLNLPKKLSKGTDNVEYIYDAAGNKLAKKKNGAFVNFYAGSIVYTGAKAVEYVMHSEGLALKSGATFAYQYNLTDHLGNVRTVLNASRTAIQANDYYPFGLTHTAVANINNNKYLYNGKEIQNDVLSGTMLILLDYGARHYCAFTGRWLVIDPMAEKYMPYSSYVYCINNPLRFIDPDGRLVDIKHLSSKHQRALRIYTSTNEGFKFISRYMKAGESLTIAGKTFKFENNGDRAKDWLMFSSQNISSKGRNRTYIKGRSYEINQATTSEIDNIIKEGVHQSIILNKNLSEEEAVGVLGHETFVHADKDADALTELDNNKGALTVGEKLEVFREIVNSANNDHRELGEGRVIKFLNYAKQLSKETGDEYYEERYNQQVEDYKNR